jgi:hypothetical protein
MIGPPSHSSRCTGFWREKFAASSHEAPPSSSRSKALQWESHQAHPLLLASVPGGSWTTTRTNAHTSHRWPSLGHVIGTWMTSATALVSEMRPQEQHKQQQTSNKTWRELEPSTIKIWRLSGTHQALFNMCSPVRFSTWTPRSFASIGARTTLQSKQGKGNTTLRSNILILIHHSLSSMQRWLVWCIPSLGIALISWLSFKQPRKCTLNSPHSLDFQNLLSFILFVLSC